MGGSDGDDFVWEGLACPPLEDYAFNFDSCTSALNHDFLDNLSLDIEDDDDGDEELDKMVAECLANPPTPLSHLLDDFPHLPTEFMVINRSDQITNVATHSYGKGKVLKTLVQVLPFAKHSKITFDCRTEQPEDMSMLDQTRMVSSAQGRRGALLNDNLNYHPHCYGNHGKGKVLKTLPEVLLLENDIKTTFYCKTQQPKDRSRLDQTNHVVPMDNKRKDNNDDLGTEGTRHGVKLTDNPNKRKIMDRDDTQPLGGGYNKRNGDYNSKPLQQKNTTPLEYRNQTAVVDDKRIDEYESRFEASRQMLHKAYKKDGEAKQQRHIQVIDFQKLETQQPGAKGKAKGKPSLRQKLMAMGTRKSNKKFPPYKMLSSCNY